MNFLFKKKSLISFLLFYFYGAFFYKQKEYISPAIDVHEEP